MYIYIHALYVFNDVIIVTNSYWDDTQVLSLFDASSINFFHFSCNIKAIDYMYAYT